jgi:N-acetylglucosamine transport system permease protein
MTAPVPNGGAPTRARRRARLTFDSVSFMAVFLGVPLALFIVFVIWPFIQAGFYSLTDWGGFSRDFNFIGLDNFTRLAGDQRFLTALGNNVKLSLTIPLLTIVIALAFATLVTIGGRGIGQTSGVRGAGFYRVVSFFPYVIPAVVIGVIFARVFDPSSGLLNAVLPQAWQQNWLGQVSTAMPASIFVIIWGYIGFYMLLFIAAIKDIPAEVLEAVRLDGASRVRTAFSITIPMIIGNLQTAWVYLGIASLDAFVTMAILNAQGGPNNSTLVMSQYLFENFKKGQYGYASALGVAMAVVTLAYAALVFGVMRIVRGKDS